MPSAASTTARGEEDNNGLIVSPFRALRYDPARVSSLAAVTSPPYDVVEESEARTLESADPHNIIRLILPREDDCGPEGPYEHAAQTLRAWIADGTLRRDPDPAIYVLEQVQEQDGRRLRGILGALTLSGPEWRVILPHEDVMPDPVEDRLALLTATRANLEPIFLVYDGGGGDTATIVDSVVASVTPVLTTTTTDGVTHRLWTITDANHLATIADDLRPRQALIADGHHRYTAYLRYQQDRRRRDGPGPWDRALALLVDTAQTPPDLSSITRVVPGLSFEQALRDVGPQVEVSLLHEPGDVLARLLHRNMRNQDMSSQDMSSQDMSSDVTRSATPAPADAAMAIVDGDRRVALLTIVDPEYQDVSAAEFLTAVLLAQRWRDRSDGDADGRDTHTKTDHTDTDDTNTDDTDDTDIDDGTDASDDTGTPDTVGGDRDVRYVHDVDTAIRLAAETGGVAIVLRPPTVEQVVAVAQSGRTMPRKSTAFGPKPRDGLVMRTLGEG
ncbi:MAG TPA: DUF1015 domain-containing protein [Acidothermales bacterium]